MAGGSDFTIRMSGEKAGSVENVAQVLSTTDALFREVARSMGVNPDEIRLEVGNLRWICDGCESERPDDHADWTKRDGLDFCPECSARPDEGEPR